MLDEVVDKEAGAEPKLVGPPAPRRVGSPMRHISPGELDAYVEGRLSGARLDFVRNHLDACGACRAELTDLRTHKASAVGISQASSLKRELERRRRQRMLKSAATACIVAAVVAAIGVAAWNEFGKAWVHRVSLALAMPATSGQPPARAHATTTNIASTTAKPGDTAAPVVPDRSGQAAPQAPDTWPVAAPGATVLDSPQHAKTDASTAPLAKAAATGPTGETAARTVVAGSTSFALLEPVGDQVSDDRPEFAWQPLEGATQYAIIIVDEGLRPIAHARLKTTTWRPRKPLRRGRGYLWQVTAILKNGTKVMAKGPASQEARIHISAPPK